MTTTFMHEWKTGFIGAGGILASITLAQWSQIMGAVSITSTAIYVSWKLWDEKIYPKWRKFKNKWRK